MKQIICLAHSPWSSLRPDRTQQLLTRIDGADILYFEPPASGSKTPKEGIQVRPNLTVYPLPPLLFHGADRKWIHRQNQKRFSRTIRNVMAKHRFRSPILWCTTPENALMIEQFPYQHLVYDCHREWDDLPTEMESDLTFAADVVFAASEGLKHRLSPCNDNIAVIPNGVTPRMFIRDGLTPPAVLANLPHPVFARVGDLSADLELEPLVYAARQHPEWTFVLIGRVNRAAAGPLYTLPNVYLTGEIPAVDLPDYLSGCDVLFDLLRSNRRGSDILSARVYEYLATGKPIVAMIEPEKVESFPDVIHTAYDSAGFVRRCHSALGEHGTLASDRRLEHARKASWSNRANEVAEILRDTGLF